MRSRRGQALVLFALVLPLLGAAMALGLSVGTAYVLGTRLQNAVDAAALAGAQMGWQGSAGSVPAQSALISKDDPGATGSVAVTGPNTVTATGQAVVPGGFAALFGHPTITIRSRAVAIWGPGPAFDYAVLQGDRNPNAQLIFNGTTSVTGTVHSNDQLVMNGNVAVDGACQAESGITANGTNTCTLGTEDPGGIVPLPLWTPAELAPPQSDVQQIGSPSNPEGLTLQPDSGETTVSWNGDHVVWGPLVVDGNAEVQGNNIVHGSVTFNGSATITGDWLVYGNIIFDGSTALAGSVTAVGGTITFNGSASQADPNAGVAYASIPLPGSSAATGIILNGHEPSITGILYAPAGSLTLNGGADITGAVIANTITFNGAATIVYDGGLASAVPVQYPQLVQ
jgi:Flp pilus assembly protein TadG